MQIRGVGAGVKDIPPGDGVRLASPGSVLLENRTVEHPWALGLKPSPLHQPMMGPGLEPPTPKGGQMARKPGLARQSVASHGVSGAWAVTPALG